MENQLANSSCFVSTLDRFITITENQNRNNPPPSSTESFVVSLLPSDEVLSSTTVILTTTPEKKTLPRRYKQNQAKVRLSRITHESASLIEQRLLHRDQCVKKIQNKWKCFYTRLQESQQLQIRSQMVIHYQVLTYLLTSQFKKKCAAILVIQRCWKGHIILLRIKQNIKFTQQNRWSISQAQRVQALLQGYKVRRIMSFRSYRDPIKSACMLIDHANSVLEGICEDINNYQHIQDMSIISSPNSKRRTNSVSKYLLIYYCLNRQQELEVNDPSVSFTNKKKIDCDLLVCFNRYRREFEQLPVEWAFVNNFVRQIINKRRVITDYFAAPKQIHRLRNRSFKKYSTERFVHKKESKNILPRYEDGRSQGYISGARNSSEVLGFSLSHSKENMKEVVNYNNIHSTVSSKQSARIQKSSLHRDMGTQERDLDKSPLTSGGRGARQHEEDTAEYTSRLIPGYSYTVGSNFSPLDVPLPLAGSTRYDEAANERHDSLNAARKTKLASKSLMTVIQEGGSFNSSLSFSGSPPRVEVAQSYTPPPALNSSLRRPATVTEEKKILTPERLIRPLAASINTSNEGSSFASSSSVSQHSSKPNTRMHSTPIRRSQQSSRAHLQIDIMYAENLGSVASSRRARNVMERKPGLKVTVSMPAGGGSDCTDTSVHHDNSLGHGLRVVQTTSYVSPQPISPTDPTWNYTSYCPLRLPSSSEGGDVEQAVSFWSQGIVKIEIIDSERFNEDIFLGEVTLLLSNFMLNNSSSQAQTCGEKGSGVRWQMSGLYSISNTAANVKGRSNSSGKLAAAIYLHLPSNSNSTGRAEASLTPALKRKSTASSESSPSNVTQLTTSSFHSPTVESQRISSGYREGNSSERLRRTPSTVVKPESASADVKPDSTHIVSSSVLTASSRRQRITCSPQQDVLSEKTQSQQQVKSRGIHESASGSISRRRSLENVGVVLDFLQDSLQEEADITMDSLKSNFALFRRKDGIITNSGSNNIGKNFNNSNNNINDNNNSTSSSSSAYKIGIVGSGRLAQQGLSELVPVKGSGGDIDLKTVQSDLDGIVDALNKRLSLKRSVI